ncbi:radical SAM protein [Cohnella sp. CFH 77786]|uniref:SPL family radical SAM protein n=1 Tax=Cohnella sp. CFH 77786 TaxID=2662265 RepID=UPI001C6084D5|nr:radical SAM protein [Cohnella sp. CFH 77786]MBW5444740.1 radical SAM protein [Cohnella sp. CFH 77786]
MGGFRWLTPATGYVSGYSHTLNPYVGCSFGCSYCYVRRLPVAMFRGEPWGTWAEPKKGDPASLRDELAKAKRKGPVAVFFSSATDPYQPLEAKLKLSRSLLEAMADDPPDFVLLQTRSPLVERDADMLRRLSGRVRVSMTVESDREDVRRQLTPSAPPFAARLRAVRRLREEGVETQIAVSPLLPHSPDFAGLLAEFAPRVVVDDFFRGDGSGGKRSRSLRMPEAYSAAGWSEWYAPQAADAFVRELGKHYPPEAIGFSVSGFAPRD